MKNKMIALIGLVLMVITISSCATSRKFGCPTVIKTESAKKNFHS